MNRPLASVTEMIHARSPAAMISNLPGCWHDRASRGNLGAIAKAARPTDARPSSAGAPPGDASEIACGSAADANAGLKSGRGITAH